jgi:hypothetical protein
VTRRLGPLAGLLLAGLLAGCSTPPAAPSAAAAPAVRERVREARATVTGVDAAARTVALRMEDGTARSVKAGPEARNLDQVKVGDTVVVRYREAIAAQLAPAGRADRVAETAEELSRTPPGARPGGTAATSTTSTVTVNAVDTAANTVTATGVDGVRRTFEVRDPGMREFLRTLKAGDRVDVTYSEALAIEVLPVQAD